MILTENFVLSTNQSVAFDKVGGSSCAAGGSPADFVKGTDWFVAENKVFSQNHLSTLSILMSHCMATLKLKFMDSECRIHFISTTTPLPVLFPASIPDEPIQVAEHQPENQSRNDIENRLEFSTENCRIAGTTTPIPQTRCI